MLILEMMGDNVLFFHLSTRSLCADRDGPTTGPDGADQAGPHDQQVGPRGVRETAGGRGALPELDEDCRECQRHSGDVRWRGDCDGGPHGRLIFELSHGKTNNVVSEQV